MNVASGSAPIWRKGDQMARRSLPAGPPVRAATWGVTAELGRVPALLTAVAADAPPPERWDWPPATPFPALSDALPGLPWRAPDWPFGLPEPCLARAVAGRAVGEPGRTGPC